MQRFLFITIMIVLGIGGTTNAQPIVFNKVYDKDSTQNASSSIIETIGGGYLIAGTFSGGGNAGTWLIKINDVGDTLWTKKYDFGLNNAYDLFELSNGNILLCGTLHDTATVTAKGYLMLVNAQGDSLWMQQYGSGSGTNYDWATNIAQTPDGGFVISGFSWLAPNHTTSDVWIFKTDSLGNLLWQKQFDGYGRDDFFEKVIITPDGNIVCAGTTAFDGITRLDYVVKMNQQGDTLWTKQFGGLKWSELLDFNNTLDGGFIGCGARVVASGKQQASIFKLDSLGNVLWYNTFARGNGVGEYYNFSSVHELPNGNFMAAGVDYDYTQPVPGGSTRIRMMEFNNSGDSIWSKQYPHSTDEDEDYVFDMKLTTDGGFIMCGYVIHSSPTRNDALVIKIDSNRCDNVPCQLSVGVEETSNFKPQTSNFKVYPNPTTGILTIELKNETIDKLIVEIYNLLGEKVYNGLVTQNSININHLNNGVYFLQLKDKNNKHLVTQKLMLQK